MVVERDEIVLVRRKRSAVRFWCNQCEAQVSMLRVEDASALVGAKTRTIYRWIEAGKVHFAESDKGLVLICTQSLATLTRTDCCAEREKKGPNDLKVERPQSHASAEHDAGRVQNGKWKFRLKRRKRGDLL